MDTSSSCEREIDLHELENFALAGIEAQVDAIVRQPGFAILSERIRLQAIAEGRAEAKQEYERKRRELTSGPVQQLHVFLAELALRREEFAQRDREELLQLALAIARRVVRVECVQRPEAIEARLAACLRQLEKESSYVIRVNPALEEALEGLLGKKGLPHLPDLPYRIIGDRRVPEGSLVLEGERTRLESICEDELDRLEEHLLQLYREQEADDAP